MLDANRKEVLLQRMLHSPEAYQMALMEVLMGIHGELQAIREATEQANEPGPDDEPSPFQSLSG